MLALGILLASCPCAFALDPSLDVDQYAHASWTVREGFSQGIIFSIVQTYDGYLWLGTEFGLLRFDGVKTIPWEPPADQHLPSSMIKSLLVARDGTLWIGTWKGLASWKDGKLTLYPDLAGLLIMALLEDRVATIPKCQAEADQLMTVADPANAVFAPAVSARTCMIMGKVFPCRAARTVILAHRSPLALG